MATKNSGLQKGDRVAVIAGRYAGRNGKILRLGKQEMADYARVEFDSNAPQDAPKHEFVRLNSLLPEVKL